MVKLTFWPLWIISTEQPPSDILFIPDFTNIGQHYCYAFLHRSNDIFLIQSQMAVAMHNDLKQSLYKDCGELTHFFCTGPCNTVCCKCRHAILYHIHDILQISDQTILISLLYISKNLTALLSGHFFHLWSEMWIKCYNTSSGTQILTRQETEVILDGQIV